MTTPPARVITRNRDKLACKECRRRKLRCDRLKPCSSCLRRGDETSCTYQPPAPVADRSEQQSETQARLEHLEQLVQQLASQASQPQQSSLSLTPPSQGFEAGGSGQHNIVGSSWDASCYNGATHWSAMLHDIQELKLAMPIDDMLASNSQIDDDDESSGVEILFGGATPLPLDVVLATYMPARQEVDRMISAYFRAGAVKAPFIHASQFRRLYQEFWQAPSEASPLWISILFSICHISANALKQHGNGQWSKNQFSVAAAHCLALGHYFRPRNVAVEALTVFIQAHCLTSRELPSDIGALVGLVIRLATKMGYHKDQSLFQLSPFEDEMRRRTWSFCMQLDVIISFHLGIPTSVQFPTWDTRAPRALLDSDFDENSVQLPPSRPAEDVSHMSFSIAKHAFMVVFEKVLRHTLSASPDVSELDGLDAEIRAVFSALPEPLKPRPIAESVVDSASLIVTRLCVSFVYCKCLCVLHRPYVTQNCPESIAVCYEVASQLVGGFTDAYYEFTAGGQAETESWFLSAISWHDFLFGIMALCLVLCASTCGHYNPTLDVQSSLKLLEKARKLCRDQEQTRHKDTKRVMVLLDAVIQRLGVRDAFGLNLSFNEPVNMQMNSTTGGTGLFQNAAPWDSMWNNDEIMTGIAQDPSWKYFQQFLNVTVAPEL
ncbi:hypothetical protein BKA67DRAFT_557117 [Truncatella angustata]|uniref:Zn(2)-C6 fungal-type domain-containing protein n=1 Tax=Truncatella angustata TaxID=152316 RepID=A0A9P9A2L6_9PEZI|nr:uncharacterized protein BKA67DRAFT_557117 [Truncatella angustata]KAH6658085.1 hypothetical protein BKA67DRAFT_557117 [Truncatella angustata]